MDALKFCLEYILTPSPLVMILGFAIVLLVPIGLHFILSASASYRDLPAILLLGPSGAGKTALLTLYERAPRQATGSLPPQTRTSQVPVAVELAAADPEYRTGKGRPLTYRDDLDAAGAPARKFLLVDTPGHSKLRAHALARLSAKKTPSTVGSKAVPAAASTIKAVIFVVDAAALSDVDSETLANTAEYLYAVLLALQKRSAKASVSARRHIPSVLVAVNKMDLFAALPVSLTKSRLEAEITRIRRARTKGLLDSGVGGEDEGGAPGAGAEADEWLGEYGSEKFVFAQMDEFDVRVEIVAGSVVGDEPGAAGWWEWISGVL